MVGIAGRVTHCLSVVMFASNEYLRLKEKNRNRPLTYPFIHGGDGEKWVEKVVESESWKAKRWQQLSLIKVVV